MAKKEGKQSFLNWFLGKKPPELPKTKEETLFKVEKITEVIALPELSTTLDVRYPLIPPYAYAHIFWDPENNELVYYIEEPELNEDEKKVLKLLEDGVRELINISFINIQDQATVIEYLEKNLKILLNEFKIRLETKSFLKMMYYIYRDFVGMNEIEPMLNDYFIEDIECNGSKTPLYIVHRKYRHIRTNVIFPDNKPLMGFVEKLAQKCGKYVSYANPLLDGVLPEGSRVNATYTTDITSRGPTFTIRMFAREPWTPIKLMDFGTVSPEILAYLWLLIEHERNIMVIGGTGSGKTSFLNSIAFFIPPASRIVSIEDTRELNMLHENWLPSVARTGVGLETAAGKKHGEVSLFTLLKESFRQRPDYVIVGEIRGEEAFVLFQGAASGHPSMATMHADSVETMINRLETPPISLSPGLVETLDIVCVMIQTKIKGKPVRRLRDITEIISVSRETGKAITNTPFVRDPARDIFYFKADSRILDEISKEHGIAKQTLYQEFKLRAALLMAMYRQRIFGFKDVQEIINQYSKDPISVLRTFRIIK